MGRIVLLCCLASCNEIYGLDETKLRPPEVVPDADGDGVADAIDNCRDVANATQNDEDNDSLGDACDNCPLVENPDQNDVGDDDGVGDRCDPHPEAAGDCLVLYDSFDRDFAEAWDVLGASATAKPGNVELAPGGGGVALVARGLTGAFDVIVAGDVALGPSTSLLAATGITTPTSGLTCGVGYDTDEALFAGNFPPSPYNGFSPTLGSRGLFRLVARATATAASCRAALGVAEMALEIPSSVPASGGPGVLASGKTSTIRGIAVYAKRTPCEGVTR